MRLYSDPTNDLDSDPTNDRDGDGAGGFGTIAVTNGANSGKFNVTLTNTSDQTVYPGILTPVAYAVYSGDVQLFTPANRLPQDWSGWRKMATSSRWLKRWPAQRAFCLPVRSPLPMALPTPAALCRRLLQL